MDFSNENFSCCLSFLLDLEVYKSFKKIPNIILLFFDIILSVGKLFKRIQV